MKPLHSIYTKILLTILLCFALPLSMVFFYSYHSMETIIQQKITQQACTYLERVNKSIQDTVNQISQTAICISTDWHINELLNSYYQEDETFNYSYQVPSYMSKYDYLVFSSEIQKQLSNYAENWLPEGSEISLLLPDGQFFCTWASYNTDFDVLTDILQQNNGDTYLSGPHPPLIRYTGNMKQISLTKNIYNIYDTWQIIGTVIVTVPIHALEQILISYQNETLFSYYIMDNKNTSIANAIGKKPLPMTSGQLIQEYNSLHMNERQSTTLDNVFIDSISLEGPSWKIYLLAPYDNIFQELYFLREAIIGIGSCLILLLTVVTLLLLYLLFSPLRKLTASMYEIEQGNWDTVPPPIRSMDEIASLTERFNHLIIQLRLMFEKEKESERQKGELKYEAMLAQINPHFLFNTLNSIKWMAMMIRADNIVATIRSLARLLEISMNRQKDVLPVHEEIKNLQSYLDIQTLRYNGLYTASFDIDSRLNNLECIKLIFQPIIENAIIYNIQEEKTLDIRILGKLEFGNVIFTIIDNGKGMSQERIQQILSNDITHEKSVFRGIGLNYVQKSLQLKYGHDSGISIESTLGKGTAITVRFPAIPYENEEEGGIEP